MKEQLSIANLYNLEETITKDYLSGFEYPWEALKGIGAMILELGRTLPKDEYQEKETGVFIAKSAKVAPSAMIHGPAIIGKNAEIRHCAFIRGNAVIGDDTVVGNSTELKNVILFNKVQVPHYNYVGDSILGYRSHMGAGAITSNIKSDRTPVVIRIGDDKVETGLIKMGAMVGDNVEIGCNSVLNPGTVIGKNSNVYPLSKVRGYVEAESIFKDQNDIVKKKHTP